MIFINFSIRIRSWSKSPLNFRIMYFFSLAIGSVSSLSRSRNSKRSETNWRTRSDTRNTSSSRFAQVSPDLRNWIPSWFLTLTRPMILDHAAHLEICSSVLTLLPPLAMSLTLPALPSPLPPLFTPSHLKMHPNSVKIGNRGVQRTQRSICPGMRSEEEGRDTGPRVDTTAGGKPVETTRWDIRRD